MTDNTYGARLLDKLRVSAVVATYNGEAYILEQLRSIAAQTRPVDEVIIADDGSNDRTVDLVRAFIEQSAPGGWQLIVNEHNLGYAENFHSLMNACTGDIILLCDQDDRWTEHRVEVMTDIMIHHPEVELLNTDCETFSTGEPAIPPPEVDSDIELQKYRLDQKTFFLKHPGCVMCVRRSFYREIEMYWKKDVPHDAFLWGMAMMRESCYYAPYLSLMRRTHPDQTSGKIGHDKSHRIRYLIGVIDQCEALRLAGEAEDVTIKTKRLYAQMERTHRYRLELVRDKKWSRALLLIPKLGYYHAWRSYPVELLLAMKG